MRIPLAVSRNRIFIFDRYVGPQDLKAELEIYPVACLVEVGRLMIRFWI